MFSSESPESMVDDPLPKALPSLWRTFRLGMRVEPRLLGLAMTTTLARLLPDALIAVAIAVLTNGVVEGDRDRIVAAALALAVLATATWFLGVIDARVSRRFRDRIACEMERHIAGLLATVPTIEHQERPDHLDRLRILRDHSFTLDHLFSSLLTNIGLAVRLGITALLLWAVHPALVLLLLAGVPALLVSLWRPAVQRAVEERAAAHDRLARHLFEIGATPAPAKEVRVTGTATALRARRRAARAAWLKPIEASRWVTAWWSAASWALFGLAFGLGVAWVAGGLERPAAEVVLVVIAGQRLSQYVAQTAAELGFLRGVWLDASLRLTWLEDVVTRWDAGSTEPAPDRLADGITVEGVSFRYPGTDRLSLEDVSVALPAGSVVAIVGENGAGKTTLVKLLAAMYRPTSGRIMVDGIDLATIDTAAWRERLAGAFQDFFRFELTAQHSVGVGELERLDDAPAAERAVARAGATDVLEKLPAGLATQLGASWPDGAEMSHGQWQKLALARGFMRDEPLLSVLDEPTSALDAETEHALFERYAEAAREGAAAGRITLLVSHRFSTVRMADLILVMEGARLTEVGTHDELMARAGTYADLFTTQAQAYG
jgi:ATP-binding cassette subfamily B protein